MILNKISYKAKTLLDTRVSSKSFNNLAYARKYNLALTLISTSKKLLNFDN